MVRHRDRGYIVLINTRNKRNALKVERVGWSSKLAGRASWLVEQVGWSSTGVERPPYSSLRTAVCKVLPFYRFTVWVKATGKGVMA